MRTVSIFLAIFAACEVAGANPVYTVTDLGTLGGDTSHATSINNLGQVVGYSDAPGSSGYAFLYSGGTLQNLGTPPGVETGRQSQAFGINDSGQIAGWAYAWGYAQQTAFLYSTGTMTATWLKGYAYAINNRGTSVGTTGYNQPGGPNAIIREISNVYPFYTFSIISTTPSAAYAINDAGAVVGANKTNYQTDIFARNHAFLYSGGVFTDLTSALGITEQSASTAYGINNNGQIVGTYEKDGGLHAFLISGSTATDLGTLGGNEATACDISNSGLAVGTSKISASSAFHGFLYANGHLYDLNTLIDPASGWMLTEAKSINDAGQIVGNGISPSGNIHGFLLDPTGESLPSPTPPATPAPEPAAIPEATPSPEAPEPPHVVGETSLTTTDTSVVIKGNAAPQMFVQYRVGQKARFLKAKGSAHWKIKAPLKKGKNVIYIQTVDPATALTSKRTVVQVIRN